MKILPVAEEALDSGRRAAAGARPGTAGISALVDLLAPAIEKHSYLGSAVKNGTKQIKQLIRQQFMSLDLLTGERQAIEFGSAGSGMTPLAMKRA
jgi:hypothetical protein